MRSPRLPRSSRSRSGIWRGPDPVRSASFSLRFGLLPVTLASRLPAAQTPHQARPRVRPDTFPAPRVSPPGPSQGQGLGPVRSQRRLLALSRRELAGSSSADLSLPDPSPTTGGRLAPLWTPRPGGAGPLLGDHPGIPLEPELGQVGTECFRPEV